MIHLVFDVLAIILAFYSNKFFRNKYNLKHQLIENEEYYYWYLLVAVIGLFVGAFGFGSLNLYLSGVNGIAKSFIGGVFGAIFCIEIFKWFIGYKASTGLYYIVSLCVLIIVGRFGCFFAGIEDFTYGIESQSVFAYDFGDGILRLPVQLYESASIFIFLLAFIFSFSKYKIFWQNSGFYLFILYYASQRFIWEFLKPYANVFLYFNIFHILTLLLIIWATLKLVKNNDS